MSVPTEFDWAIVKIGDGESPEVFTQICGITDASINMTANSSDRFPRDCTKLGEVPTRKTRATGKQLDVTGTGLSNSASVTTFMAALGIVGNYKIEGYQDDGTDAGDLLGTFAGAFRMTAANLSVTREGDSSGEITLANHGAWTWTAA